MAVSRALTPEEDPVPTKSYSHLTRQLTLIPVDELQKHTVHIIGAGAIGSFTALALAKMGVEAITVWDFDEVGVENISCQIYGAKHMGMPKVRALGDIIKSLTEVTIGECPVRVTAEEVPHLHGIVVLAVDTMKARKDIATAIGKVGVHAKLLIDPRMGAEKYNQIMVAPHTEEFRAYLINDMYSDRVVANAPCTAKATVYTALLASGMIAKSIKNYIMGQPYPRELMWDIASTSETSLVMFPHKE
jgi:molybdopterin/thiamine biosynthesis adenylyltransferase